MPVKKRLANLVGKASALPARIRRLILERLDFERAKLEAENSILQAKVASLAGVVGELGVRYSESSREYEDKILKSHAAASLAGSDGPIRHPDSWVNFSDLSRIRDYKPTYRFDGPFVNGNHKFYSECPTGLMDIGFCINVGIDGFLSRADALKLYELAYFCEGEILELGTHKGLSTSILCQALSDARSRHFLETVDIDESANREARKNVKNRPGGQLARFNLIDATRFMDGLIGQNRKFALIFVDHWHGYQATYEAAQRSKKLLAPGGFVIFHDFNDPSNLDLQSDYGVYRAVIDSLIPDKDFEFYGIYGCCALFRKIS
ncbi:MAG: hypothetical protein C4523_16680 [Myxococcales bacterium]|nr:MAG: hypothetical protein C4523_16680 [Myxococcales bacterium]